MINPWIVYGVSIGAAGIALLVGWYIDREESKHIKEDCKIHSWSESVLDGKVYCMECNRRSNAR